MDALNLFLTRSVTYTYLFYFLVMQMDAEFKKEQNGTLFVPGGAVLGDGGVGGLYGPPAENFGMMSITFFFTLLLARGKRHNAVCKIAALNNISKQLSI